MVRTFFFWIAIALILFSFLFPVFWVYVTSLKSGEDIFSTGMFFTPTLENYKYVLEVKPSLVELTNSILISVISTFFVILVSVPAAYSFARFNTGGGHLLFITISTRMFPGVVAAIPFFIAFKELGLLDTHIGLTLMYVYFNKISSHCYLYYFSRS